MKTYTVVARIEIQGYDSVDALMEFGKAMALLTDVELVDIDIEEAK